jgi:hypothetical protein
MSQPYDDSRVAEISRLLRREVGKPWMGRSIHEITKRDVVDVVSAIEQRGAPWPQRSPRGDSADVALEAPDRRGDRPDTVDAPAGTHLETMSFDSFYF